MNANWKVPTVLVLLLALAAGPALAGIVDTAEDVGKINGNPSPDQVESNVNEYTYQDEQINITPDDGILRVLRTDQKININEFVPVLIPVREASVRELRPIARDLCAKEGGWAQVVMDKKKKQYFIQATCPPYMVEDLKKAIAMLDREWVNATDDGTGLIVYQAKHRDIGEIVPLGLAFVPGRTAEIDSSDNSVTYSDAPVWCSAFNAVMERTDVPANQIYVEGRFYEVSTVNDKKIGVDYIAWKNGPGINLFEFILAGMKVEEDFRGASSIFNPVTALLSAEDLARIADGDYIRKGSKGRQRYGAYNAWLTAAYLDFLQSRGKAKVIATPQIQTRSGLRGSWASSTPVVGFQVSGSNNKIPYSAYPDLERAVAEVRAASPNYGTRSTIDGNFTGGTGDLGVYDRQLEYANYGEVGAFLDILPFVGLESTEMGITASISSVTGYTPQGLPTIADRTVSSYVRVRDGDSLVLSGLKRNEDVVQKAGMPFLGDIPVLGYLFSGETSAVHTTDVVITLDVQVSTGVGSRMELSPEMARMVSSVEGDEEVPSMMVRSRMGFDQWLLDPEK